MDLSVFRLRGAGAFAALLATTIIGAGTMRANTLTITGATAISCNTATGSTVSTVLVKLGTALTTGSLAVNVTGTGVSGALTGGLIVTPVTTNTFTVANQSAGLQFTISASPGCANAIPVVTTSPATITASSSSVIFTPVAGTSNTQLVADTLTATTSALNASAVTIQCRTDGVVGPPVNIPVTSLAAGGTPFTVDTAASVTPDVASAAWLSVLNSYTGGTASSAAAIFGIQAATGCGSHSTLGTSFTTTIYLDNAPAPAKQVVVTMQIVAPIPLVPTFSPSSSLTYVKGTGNPTSVTVSVPQTTPPSLYITVNTNSLPTWLTVGATSGTAPANFVFSSTSACDTLAPGTYTATVYLRVSGYADTPLSFTMQINNKPPKLSVTLLPAPSTFGLNYATSTPTTQNITWSLGSTQPAPVINLVSSDSPIAYTAVGGGGLAPTIPSAAQQAGLAYSFGTQINVVFATLPFSSASPGSVLTGTVTLTWGSSNSTIVVTFNITVQSPAATLTSLSPASLPTAAPGSPSFPVTLVGAGFVQSADPSQKTKVGIVVGGVIVVDANFTVNVVNPSNIQLGIAVPALGTDNNLPFAVAGLGGNVVIGVCNPLGTTCSIPSGQATLVIGAGPIIQAVTSASSFTEVAPGTLPTTSAYDMLSVFGQSFCSSGGTGCSSTQILYGTPDALTQRYPTSVTPDSTGTIRNVTATFYVHGTGGAWIGNAPILFVTNSQINLVVPAAVIPATATTVDLVVNFGTALPGLGSVETASATSAVFPMTVALTDPGVFTVGADGQGVAAVLNANTYAQVNQTNPAGMQTVGTNSDTVALYVTGLGLPDSSAADATGGSFTNITDCIQATGGTGTTSYESVLQGATSVSPALANVDGAIMQYNLIEGNGNLPPCMVSTSGLTTIPGVTIGTVPATLVGYTGFVASAVAGLYQINVTLPASSGGPFYQSDGTTVIPFTQAVQMPVLVTTLGGVSQGGVNIWVAPRLTLTAPPTISGYVGQAWTGSDLMPAPTGGTGPYTYSLTSGSWPAGLTMTGAGLIAGTPLANTNGQFLVTVTATDNSSPALTGRISFTLTVTADLYLSLVTPGALTGFASGGVHAVTTVNATSGNGHYTFSLTSVTPTGSGAAAGDVTLDTATGAVGFAASCTAASSYVVVVHVVDTTTGTPLTGNITFTIATT